LRLSFRQLWDRFLLYLPLLLMGGLALVTYWLVRTASPASVPVAPQPVSQEPDYFVQGFAVKTYDASGQVRTEVLGRNARHYPQTQWLEIDHIQIRSFDKQGRLTTASAERGLTNGDISEVQLSGNAQVVREAYAAGNGQTESPRATYRSEFLHAFMRTERLQSHKPVEVRRGSDQFTADSLEYDGVAQVLVMQGRVRGTLSAK